MAPAGALSGSGVPAAVALGSSLGPRRAFLELALRLLDATPGLEVLRVSRLYRTPPDGGVARGWFLNAVALLRCALAPEDLLDRCKAVEARLGRVPGLRWGDRRVDLDVLLVGSEVRDGPGFRLHHPAMATRPFVMVPLLEVLPGAVDPRTGRPFPQPRGGWRPRPVPLGVLATRPASGYGPAPQLEPGPGASAPRSLPMQIFIDTANLAEIREAASWGILDGCTTNPSLIAREGGDFVETVHEICTIVNGPVSAEVVAQDAGGMVREGRLLARIHDHVVVKVPLTVEGLKATKVLSGEGIRCNVTLCFQPAQALLAAKAGATYISPFIGRLDDVCTEGMDLIRQIVEIYGNYPNIDTQVLVASVRHPQHVVEAALVGADVVTAPFGVLKRLVHHPLTDKGNAAFLEDWKKVPDTDIEGQVTRWLARAGR